MRSSLHRSFPRLLSAAALFAVASLAYVQPAASQEPIRIPGEGSAANSAVAEVLTKGKQLESQHRWGEALSFYEEALRDLPGQSEIESRITRARMRYDLRRRYHDQSFLTTLRATKSDAALDQYGEVLLKIEAHYVHTPKWREIVERGAANLEALLNDPESAKHLGLAERKADVAAYLAEFRRNVRWTAIRTREHAKQVADYAARLAHARLQLTTAPVVLEFTCGASAGLDSYSEFLTHGRLSEVFSQIEGNFVGLGIELKPEQGMLRVVNVITGSPAEQGGMKDGDRIIAVDGRATNSLSSDAAADMLKGVEGSSVVVRVRRGEQTLDLKLVRRRVEVPSVDDVKIIDRDYGVAYLKLTVFQKTTSRELDAALWKLHRQGMKSLIIDLRDNPGGLLTSSVEVADKFVSQGTIVSTRGRSAREDFDYKAHRVGTWRVPLVVLIDRNSASASEIFAGAVRDLRRATIVGERSYGKGSVQGIFPLSQGKGGVRLTTAKFYSPSGQPISRRGVSPDVKVRRVLRPTAEGQVAAAAAQVDPFLDAGIRAARQQLSRR